MNDPISEYQKWKQQGKDLRIQAKQAMESRFRDLLMEAMQIAEEYRADFGASLKPPPHVTALRFRRSARPKKKPAAEKVRPAPKKERASARTEQPASKPNRIAARLQKRLVVARKKLDDAKAAGAPTRTFEDRIYELEDELRLAGQA